MFKPGQTVKCIESDGTPLVIGDLYTIAKVFRSSSTGAELCCVKEIEGDWYANRFESITFAPPQKGPPTYSCVGAGGGASDPADVVHGSNGAAQAVIHAIELSQKHNGKTHMSSGGPYIASSVYSELKQQYKKAVDSLLSVQLELERVKEAYANRHKELTDMQTRIKELEKQRTATNKPQFVPPPYIKSGWWIAMDGNSEWWVYEKKPIMGMHSSVWTSVGTSYELLNTNGITRSMREVPITQWQQTLLQIP